MTSKRLMIFTLAALLLAACGGQEEPTPAPPPAEAPTAVPPTDLPPATVPPTEVLPTAEPTPEEQGSRVETMEHVPDPQLTGITWEWIQRDPNGNSVPPITVSNPENYSILFNDDGTFNAVMDCNTAAGQYATPNPGSIFMELGPTTLAACGDDSLDADMFNMFGPAQNYRLSEDGSSLEFIWVAGGPIDTYRNAALEVPGEEEIKSIPPDSIVLDTGTLASSFQWEVVPGNPIPQGPGGLGFPPHIVLTFDGQSPADATANGSSIMYIFPIEAYIAMYNDAGNTSVASQVIRLQELIATADGRTEIPESPVPLLPPPSSFMGRWAQYADLNFGAGSGVRFVSEAPNRQGIGPWVNLGTAYYYQGLSSDNRFYVSLRWPVSTDLLPNTPEDVPDEIEAQSTDPDTYPAYLQETIDSLNAAAPADWIPSLAAIDAMASSLAFPTGEVESETSEEEEEVDLPDAQAGAATGTVTADDGVFIRTGPGTEYPALGALPFGESGEIVGKSADGLWWVFNVPEGIQAPNNQGWVTAEFIEAQNAAAVPVVPAPEVEPVITGTTWGWVSTTSPVAVTTADDPARYTILFNADGSANIKADCNNVIASYTTDGSSISIVPGPSTLVACPEDSLDQQFLLGLENAALYFFQEGDFFMDIFADGGTMRFTAQSAPAANPDADAGADDGADAGTGTPIDPQSPTAATGTLFNISSFGPTGAEQPILPGTSITALFSATQINGSAGCNEYTGQLIPVEDHFTVGPLATTQRLCTEPAGIMEQEQAFLAALQATDGYQWSAELVNGTAVITAGQLLYTTAENLPGVINMTSQ